MSNTLKSWMNAYFSQSGFIALQQEQAHQDGWNGALKQIYVSFRLASLNFVKAYVSLLQSI